MSTDPEERATEALRARLEGLHARITRLWTEPDALRQQASWLSRLWLRVSGGGRERLASEALAAFRSGEDALVRWPTHRDAIVDELSENVERLEKSARVDGEAPAPMLVWLFGVHRWALAMERAYLRQDDHARLALTRGLASRALLGPPPEDDPGTTIALAGVDAILNEAAQETGRLARRRHLLEAARRILIDAEAAAPEREAFEERRELIARELLQLERITKAGIDADVSLHHQLARAGRRRQPARAASACAALRYLEGERSDAPERPGDDALVAQLSAADPSAEGLLPSTVEEAVTRGYRRAREQAESKLETAALSETLALRRRRQYLSVDAHLALLRMALGVDGVFDVGGRLEREQVDVVSSSRERVPFPTQELALHPVSDPSDVRGAVIEDPRLLLYHLASRRLLQRRYVRQVERKRRGGGVRAAVRFYLLDGSTSMRGARARMRDAILVAELASHVSRLERPGGRIRSLLYYRYFNSDAETTRRIASIAEALEAIEEVLGTMRGGRTDIEGALLDSIDLIAGNRANDVELSRAQLVLVTDGAAPVDAELIAKAQRGLDVPVRVSVIALGEENPELRQLAATQREAGLRVLYHHVGDDALARWETGYEDDAWPSFSAADAELEAPEGALDELASLADDRVPVGPDDHLVAGLREVGLDETHLGEGARAELELGRRDLRALGRRFDRLFPEPRRGPQSVADVRDEALTVALDALAVVAEVLGLGPSDTATKTRDAIAILERLLRERGLAPDRYLALVHAHPDVLGPAIAAVRAHVARAGGAAGTLRVR